MRTHLFNQLIGATNAIKAVIGRFNLPGEFPSGTEDDWDGWADSRESLEDAFFELQTPMKKCLGYKLKCEFKEALFECGPDPLQLEQEFKEAVIWLQQRKQTEGEA